MFSKRMVITMAINRTELSCVRCKAYLFEEDDVVYCPICGAPHHRECYGALQHCALEELHGTENQYSKEKILEVKQQIIEKEKGREKNQHSASSRKSLCRVCGEEIDSFSCRCDKCGAPNMSGIGNYANFDFLGGVPADYIIEDGVTANEAKKLVLTNTHRYIPKFATLNHKNKISWNWMAFLFPAAWMFSRKMFKNGAIFGMLSVVSVLLSYPFNLAILNSGNIPASSYPELITALQGILPQINILVLIVAGLGLFLDLGIRVIAGLFGDYLYKSYAVASIKKIQNESHDAEYDYRKKGGVNILFFFLATLIIEYLPSILVSFF